MESPNDFSLEDTAGTFFPLSDLFDQEDDSCKTTCFLNDPDEEEDESYLISIKDVTLIDLASLTSWFYSGKL